MSESYISESTDQNYSLRLAKVTKVYDSDTMSIDPKRYGFVELSWLDGVGSVNRSVKAYFPIYNSFYGSGVIYMPCIGDIVICYNRINDYPIVIGYYPDKLNVSRDLWENDKGAEPIAAVRPLKSGELFIKSAKQAEIYLADDGSVKIRTKDQYKIDPFEVGELLSTRVKDKNNTDTEFFMGNVTDEYGETVTVKGNVLKHRVRVLSQDMLSEMLTYASDGLTLTKNAYKIVEVLKVTKTNVQTKTDNIVPLDLCTLLNNKITIAGNSTISVNVNDTFIVKYHYYTTQYDLIVNSTGDLQVNCTSHTVKTWDNQGSYTIGEGGVIAINGQSISSYIENTVNEVVNSKVVEALSKINLKVSTKTAELTHSFNVSDIDENLEALFPYHILNIVSISAVRNGEIITLDEGLDYKVNHTRTGIQLINNFPDYGSTITSRYYSSTEDNELLLMKDCVLLGNDTKGNITIQDDINIDPGEGNVKLGRSSTERYVVCTDSLGPITDISQLRVESSVRV